MQNLNQITSKAALTEISIMQANAKASQFNKAISKPKKDFTAILALSILTLIPLAMIIAKVFFKVNFQLD